MTIRDLAPAASGRLALGATTLARAVAAYARNALRRRRIKRLVDLDDHLLDDIGVTRHEVEIATRLPFTHDPTVELRRLAEERRRRQMSPLGRDAAVDLYARTLKPRRWL